MTISHFVYSFNNCFLIWSVLCLSRIAGTFSICFLSGAEAATRAEETFGLKKHLQLPLWNAWSTKRQYLDLSACAWACITLLTHFLFQGGLDEFYFLRWVPVNSTSSLCWVYLLSLGDLRDYTSFFWWLIPALTWTIRNSETVLCAMNIRWINARGIFKRPLKLQTVYSHKFPCDQRWHKSYFSCFRGKKTIDAVEPHLTFALHVTVDPWRQEEGSLCFTFFIYKTKINYVDFSVHKSQYVKNKI